MACPMPPEAPVTRTRLSLAHGCWSAVSKVSFIRAAWQLSRCRAQCERDKRDGSPCGRRLPPAGRGPALDVDDVDAVLVDHPGAVDPDEPVVVAAPQGDHRRRVAGQEVEGL